MKYINHILKWLFPLFAFLLPLQTRWIIRDEIVGGSAWEYGRISLYGFDVVLLCINVLLLVDLWYKHNKETSPQVPSLPRRGWGVFIIGALFFIYELFIALDPVLTGVALLRILLIVFAGQYLLHQDILVLRRTMAAFVLAMVISAGLGVAQFMAQDDLVASKWLGLAPQEASTLGVSVVETAGGRWLRAHGTMPHPNALGGFAALACALFLVLRATASNVREPSRPFIAWCESIFMIAAPLILIAGVITSVSRAAMIAFAASLAVFLWQRIRHHAAVFNERSFMMVAAGTIIVLLLALPVLSVRLLRQGRLESLSFTKRAAAFTQALDVARDHWATGTGLGGITVAMRARYPALPIWDIQPVHNIPIILFVEFGVIGLSFLGLVWWVIKRKIPNSKFQIPNKSQLPNSKFVLILPVIVCYFVLAMLDHYLWTLPAGLYLIGLVGASLALDREMWNS